MSSLDLWPKFLFYSQTNLLFIAKRFTQEHRLVPKDSRRESNTQQPFHSRRSQEYIITFSAKAASTNHPPQTQHRSPGSVAGAADDAIFSASMPTEPFRSAGSALTWSFGAGAKGVVLCHPKLPRWGVLDELNMAKPTWLIEDDSRKWLKPTTVA